VRAPLSGDPMINMSEFLMLYRYASASVDLELGAFQTDRQDIVSEIVIQF
jgi:hypothetical protein